MKRVLAFAAVGALAAFGFGRAAHAQEFPWLFAGGTTDIAAIVDQDGDGPDLTDDCYFKFTGNPALSASMTFLYVDALGETCHRPFPCTGSFVVNPGGDTTITIEGCDEDPSIPTPFTTTFSRPGPPVLTNALVSPNMGSTDDSDPPVSALFCDSQGLVAQIKINNIFAVLLPLSFYPSAADPDFLKVPFLGNFAGGTGDVFIPLVGKRATVASSTAPQTTVGEVDFGNVCDCSFGGLCPSTVSPAPAANGWGLAIAAFGLLVIGAWALRRKPRFAGDLPLP
jgi:hypothetical protein